MHLSIETGAIVQVLFRFENNCPSIDTIHVFNLIHYTYVCTIIITIYAILFLDPNWNHVLIEQNKWFELSAKTRKKNGRKWWSQRWNFPEELRIVNCVEKKTQFHIKREHSNIFVVFSYLCWRFRHPKPLSLWFR